jgi:hypothetical protein
MNICLVEAEFFRADRHVEANSRFSQSCKRRYKHYFNLLPENYNCSYRKPQTVDCTISQMAVHGCFTQHGG